MTSDGTVIATIPAGGATDAAGNRNTASTSTDNTVTTTRRGPTTSSVSALRARRTSADGHRSGERRDDRQPQHHERRVLHRRRRRERLRHGDERVRRSFDSPTEGVTATLTATQFNALARAPHTVFVHGRDAAGNWGATASQTFIKDTVSATVTANSAAGQANPTNQTPINYTVTFSEPVAGFTGVRRDAGRHGGRHEGRRRHRRTDASTTSPSAA